MQTAAAKRPPGQELEYLPQLDPQRMAETLTAFANSGGGTLVLGMDAAGEVQNRHAEEDATDALAAALRLCRPPVRTEWQVQETPNGNAVLVRVERSDELHALADGRILVRRGAETVSTPTKPPG